MTASSATPQPEFASSRRTFLRRFVHRPWLVAGLLAVVAFSTTATIGTLRPPTPAVHDEFSYLLASDTFASGRLTNPTHPHWKHFETFHVIQEPTYASKYPPGLGLALAAGQTLTGKPIVGVWLLTAAAAAACYWMMLGWVPPRWAALGGLLFVLHPCYLILWSQAYCGGTLALLGGALVFGAVPRLNRQAHVRDSLAMAAGAVLLAISRPYEGLVFCLAAGAVVIYRWVRQEAPPLKTLVAKFVLPQLAVLLVSGAALATYHQAVTGNALVFPYRVHETTYGLCPIFTWQTPGESPHYRHPIIANFHHGWSMDWYRRQDSLVSLVETKARMTGVAATTLMPLPMAVALLFLRPWRGGPTAVFVAVVLVAWLASMLTIWSFPHYMAPMAGVLLLLAIWGFRHMKAWGRGSVPASYLVGALVAFQVFWFSAIAYHYVRAPRDGWQWKRAEFLEELSATPERHLVFVRYQDDHNTHNEWVYNRADIDGSKVVWAREMEPAEDQALIDYFSDRQVWRVEADANPPRLKHYVSN